MQGSLATKRSLRYLRKLAMWLSGCGLDAKNQAAEDVRELLVAAREGDAEAFEAGIDREKLKADLRVQVREAAREQGIDIGGPSDAALDRMIGPDALRVAQPDPAAPPTAAQIAELVSSRGLTVGAAESLTGGAVSSALAAAPDASTWYHGCVVAYSPRVKQDVLGVTPGPVVTELCGRELAQGAAKLLQTDAAVSTTGVGGPDPDEGEEPGTVYVGVVVPGGGGCHRLELDGEPDEIVEQATERALELLLEALRTGGGA